MLAWVKKLNYFLYDLSASILGFLFLPLLKITRNYGVENFPLQSRLFKWIGVFPIRDHYYEPRFVFSEAFDAGRIRKLPFELGLERQLQLLQALQYNSEVQTFESESSAPSSDFNLNNGNFGPGDAELYYLMLRNHHPKNIIEIGSGYSTQICLKALEKNGAEGYPCKLVCIEPYEMPFLNQQTNITLIREPVETLSVDLFKPLAAGDILFIDSSHIIRAGNDLLFIFFEILPILQKGVLIHIHDIFTPRHYPQDWLTKKMRFWNEQYLLEAFLYNNEGFKVLFTLNHLVKEEFEAVKKVLVHIEPESEPSSFWMERN